MAVAVMLSLNPKMARSHQPNELVFTFGSSYVSVNFGKNRLRNATVRVPTDGYTDTLTYCKTQTDFIIRPMLHAIAIGEITSSVKN